MPDRQDESLLTVDFSPGVRVHRPVASEVVIGFGNSELTLAGLSPMLAGAIEALNEAAEPASLHRRIESEDGMPGLARWMGIVSRLEQMGALRYSLHVDGTPLLRFVPALRSPAGASEPPTGPLTLSRFAYVRPEEDMLVLDSPLADGPVWLCDARAFTALYALTRPAGGIDSPGWFGAMCDLLWNAGLLVAADADGTTAEDRSAAMRSWEFADLVAHARSRSVRADQPIGGTYRWRGILDPLPALKPPMSARRVALPAPDVAALTATDPSLTAVMEARRSVRRHGAHPISLAQLGELLFRVARVRKGREIASRVLPSGGECHPLEIYPIVGACDGLDSGVYHYDPKAHALEVLPGGEAAAGGLLDGCTSMMDDGMRPQVLLCVTARFRRVSWKYEGMAYAMIQKEVGVLYEALYLAATAMGLAPCALGGGDSALTIRVLELDPLEEGPAGEFVLGSL